MASDHFKIYRQNMIDRLHKAQSEIVPMGLSRFVTYPVLIAFFLLFLLATAFRMILGMVVVWFGLIAAMLFLPFRVLLMFIDLCIVSWWFLVTTANRLAENKR